MFYLYVMQCYRSYKKGSQFKESLWFHPLSWLCTSKLYCHENKYNRNEKKCIWHRAEVGNNRTKMTERHWKQRHRMCYIPPISATFYNNKKKLSLYLDWWGNNDAGSATHTHTHTHTHTPEMPTSLWVRVRVESRVFDLESSQFSSLWGARLVESRVFDLESESSLESQKKKERKKKGWNTVVMIYTRNPKLKMHRMNVYQNSRLHSFRLLNGSHSWPWLVINVKLSLHCCVHST